MAEEVRRQTGKEWDECRRILNAPTLAEYWALTGDGPQEGERRDEIEFDPAFAATLLRASLEATREVGSDWGIGGCFAFWDCKRRILRKKYGVTWRDPADLNPQNSYD
jgi:hypothetical protein